jgi:nicotinate-nucleotide adenylyltransferase
MTNKTIGILGGTFDPIHNGHLQLALAAYRQMNLLQVKFIPCYRSPHKNDTIASPQHRLKMIELAIADNLNFSLDPHDINQQKASFTIDTLRELRAKIGNDVPLCWIMAMDVFVNFDLWHQWQNISDLAHLAVANRLGSEVILSSKVKNLLSERQIFDPKLLNSVSCGKIIMFEMTPNQISATQIRNLIKHGDSAENLVPQSVWRYICQHELYRI